jgi:hypothetical protein
MLTLRIEHIGDMAIVECKGRIVRRDATLKLREAVTAQQNVRIVLLDLTKVGAIEGGGLKCCGFCSAGQTTMTFSSSFTTPSTQ